ncbi:coagulation factor XIII B chain-like isoform X1 [Garra rufa]|uniref:coagulation factor XIII B chain-like isoform X1 n=1 Tax=Garra rufa TaxID=137080 RepID=UPI003CCEE093
MRPKSSSLVSTQLAVFGGGLLPMTPRTPSPPSNIEDGYDPKHMVKATKEWHYMLHFYWLHRLLCFIQSTTLIILLSLTCHTGIPCTAPAILNGQVVEQMPQYQKGAILEYKCNPGFKKREGIPRCATFGWTPKPDCDEITCSLQSTTFGIKKMNPEGKTIFRVGEKVEIICSEKHWLIFTKETRESFTCRDNGDWDHKPVCAEIACEVPRDQHVYSPYHFRGNMKLGTKHYYYCELGYDKMETEATCTKEGWTPNPLCAKTCAAPNIQNAKIVRGSKSKYPISSRIEYQCLPGFEPEEPVEITCDSQAQWTGIQQCTEKMCVAPNIPNAEIMGGHRPSYRINSRILYICHPGFNPEQAVQITCNSQAQWTGIQQCTELTCQFESTIAGVKGVNPEGKTIFKIGESVEIICSEKHFLFTKDTSKSFTCQSTGKWDSKPVCEITCEVPHDQHVSGPEYYFSGNMKLGAKKSYSCKSGYREMGAEATCTRDRWTPNPLCDEIMCDSPIIPNAEIAGDQKLKYKINSRIQYKCRPGFEPEEPVQITCDSQGQWTGIQKCNDGTCQEQELKNIQIVFGHPSIDSPYKPGHSLIFQCTDDKMRFYGHRVIECLPDGRWNYPYPQCGGTVQCSKPIKNLQFVTLSDAKTEYSNSETLTYTCNEPYNEIPGGVLMCQNGIWNATFDCKSKICPPPPYLENGDFSSIVSTKDKVTTEVSYTCQPYYVLTKQQDVYKCVDGKWDTPPKCLRPCEIDDIVEKYNLELPTGKIFIKHAEKYRLNCKDGWNTGSEMKAYVDVSCSNGNLQIDKSCDAQNKLK